MLFFNGDVDNAIVSQNFIMLKQSDVVTCIYDAIFAMLILCPLLIQMSGFKNLLSATSAKKKSDKENSKRYIKLQRTTLRHNELKRSRLALVEIER